MPSGHRSSFRMATALMVALVATLVVAATLTSAVETGDFTEAQRVNTLKILQALSLGGTETWGSDSPSDFCSWPGIRCQRMQSGDIGAEVTITHDQLADLPADVQSQEVRITSLKMQVNTLTEGSPFFSNLAKATSSSLTLLDFTGSGLTSELPPSWGNFVNLQRIRLGDNHFYGTLPTAWSALTSLQELQLQNSNITGTLPPEWRTMTQLQNVSFDNNGFTGTLPSEWSSMTSLWMFSVVGTEIRGGLPSSWSVMSQLNLTADDVLYEAYSDSSSDAATTTTTTTASPSSGTTTTTESPSVSTDCTDANCVLCPVNAPQRCGACRPGYLLTSDRTCTSNGGNGAYARAAGWQLVPATCVALVAVMMSVF